MPVYPYNEVRPRLGERVFIAPGAVVVGHAAVVHGCTIEDGAPIGAGALVARPLDAEQQALIPEIAARCVRLEDEYLETLARGTG